MNYTIIRNNQKFGPYAIAHLTQYVQEGNILLADVVEQPLKENTTVKNILKQHNVSIKINNKGSIFFQIKNIGKELIVPKKDFITKDILKDKRLIYLAFLGLAPAFLIRFTFSTWLTFYCISLYFSVLSAVFFLLIFKTNQVKTKLTIIIFFSTQIAAYFLSTVQLLSGINVLYALTKATNIISRFIGFTLGVGILEESIKALPLLFILKNTKQPLIPQTMVYYGLISGIGFGVLEGVFYQTTTNITLNYNDAFFMNIARLTSLPFLHAVWAGIAGYFLSFSFLYPLYRTSFWLLAIIIPAFLHGFYDTFGWSLLGLASTFISVVLLMFYLKRSADYQSKLLTLK